MTSVLTWPWLRNVWFEPLKVLILSCSPVLSSSIPAHVLPGGLANAALIGEQEKILESSCIFPVPWFPQLLVLLFDAVAAPLGVEAPSSWKEVLREGK